MINMNQLITITDNDRNLMKEFLHLFVETTESDLEHLYDAIKKRDIGLIVYFSHRIRGACLMVGANRLSVFSSVLEQTAMNNDEFDFELLFEKLKRCFLLTVKRIEKLGVLCNP